MEKRILTIITALFSIAAIAQPPPPPPPNPGGGQLKINEVDYDIPGSDTAEFIEIYNAGSAVNLSGYILVLINGATATPTAYDTIFFPSVMLAANDYYVICGSGGNVINCDQMEAATSDIVQNGAPDAIALIQIAGPFMEDLVSYEGDVPGFTETTGVTSGNADNNNATEMSMSRYPDGTDTDNNDADFQRVCSTPGTVNCPTVDIAEETKRSFGIFPNPVKDDFTLTFNGIESAHVAVSNLLGEALIKKYVTGRSSIELEANQLPQGFYFVTVDTGNEILTKRFVKR